MYNFEKLTQTHINQIFDGYYKVAFPKLCTPRSRDSVGTFKVYITSPYNDGYRLGVSGWPNTKLKITIRPNGDLGFSILRNIEEDKITSQLRKRFVELEAWALAVSNT